MARVRPPFIIQPDTPYSDAWARVNENFANIASDISDYGSFRASTGSNGISATVLAGAPTTWNVTNIVTSKTGPLAGLFENKASTITPMFEVFMDTDNDDTVLLPNGSALTTNNKAFRLIWWVAGRTYASSDPDDLVVGSIVWGVENGDIPDHTYYVHISADIFPRSLISSAQGSPWR